jgi:hypothetical protein
MLTLLYFSKISETNQCGSGSETQLFSLQICGIAIFGLGNPGNLRVWDLQSEPKNSRICGFSICGLTLWQILYTSSWSWQKLAAEQPLLEQSVQPTLPSFYQIDCTTHAPLLQLIWARCQSASTLQPYASVVTLSPFSAPLIPYLLHGLRGV